MKNGGNQYGHPRHRGKSGGVSEGYLRQRLVGVVALRLHHGPLQPVELGQKNLVDDLRSLLT